MTVRRATEKDLALLIPLFNAYRQFYRSRRNRRKAKHFLGKRLKKRDSVIFLALDGPGKPCGFVQLYPSFSSVSMKRLWILNDLFVIRRARRNGVAGVLIERSVRLARETKAKGLVLETAVSNKPARTLYEKLGWMKDKTFYRYFINI